MEKDRDRKYCQWAMGPCFYCGIEMYRSGPNVVHPQKYTRDHLIPMRLRRVGLFQHGMLFQQKMTVGCCYKCNQKKGGKTAFECHALFDNLPQKKQDYIRDIYEHNVGELTQKALELWQFRHNNNVAILPQSVEKAEETNADIRI